MDISYILWIYNIYLIYNIYWIINIYIYNLDIFYFWVFLNRFSGFQLAAASDRRMPTSDKTLICRSDAARFDSYGHLNVFNDAAFYDGIHSFVCMNYMFFTIYIIYPGCIQYDSYPQRIRLLKRPWFLGMNELTDSSPSSHPEESVQYS